MGKLKNFVLSAGLLAIISSAPSCATIGDKLTRNADVAGTYVVDESLRNDINTLLNMYRWGSYSNIPGIVQKIYDQIPDELENNFFVVDAVWANAMRKEAVKAGEETIYWDSEAKFKDAFTKMEIAFDNSGMSVEEWLNSTQYVDSNRLGKWILLDSWGLLQKDYALAGLTGGDKPEYNLYAASDYFIQARELTEDLSGDWEGLRKVSERHMWEVEGILEDLVN